MTERKKTEIEKYKKTKKLKDKKLNKKYRKAVR